MKTSIAIVISLFVSGVVLAQDNVKALLNGQSVTLVMHQLVTTELPATAGSPTREFLKGAAMGGAEGVATNTAMGVIGSTMASVPVLGAPAAMGVMALTMRGQRLFHRGKKVTSTEVYNVSFVQGMTSATPVADRIALVIPASIVGGSSPVLLKVAASGKDQARIVQAVRVSITQTGSAINPVQTSVLSVENTEVPTNLEKSSSGVLTVTPTAPLEVGEYVLVLATNGTRELQATAWDFRVQ